MDIFDSFFRDDIHFVVKTFYVGRSNILSTLTMWCVFLTFHKSYTLNSDHAFLGNRNKGVAGKIISPNINKVGF